MRKYTVETYTDGIDFEVVRWDLLGNGVYSGEPVFKTSSLEEAETMCDEFTIGEMAEYYYSEPESEFDCV
jgi:hypothetical protein